MDGEHQSVGLAQTKRTGRIRLLLTSLLSSVSSTATPASTLPTVREMSIVYEVF